MKIFWKYGPVIWLVLVIFGMSALIKAKTINVPNEDCEYIELTKEELKYTKDNPQIFMNIPSGRVYKKICK